MAGKDFLALNARLEYTAVQDTGVQGQGAKEEKHRKCHSLVKSTFPLLARTMTFPLSPCLAPQTALASGHL